MGDKSKGLYGKFVVTRTDGSSNTDEKHDGCRYFVLDLDHDVLSRPAVAAYADAARSAGYEALADDLDEWLDYVDPNQVTYSPHPDLESRAVVESVARAIHAAWCTCKTPGYYGSGDEDAASAALSVLS